VDEDEKVPYILQSEVENAIKEIRDKRATGDDDVPGDVLKLLGEDGLRQMTQLINSIYVTAEWPRDFIEVTMIALKKKPKAIKCSDHRTISIIAHAAKIVARILRRRIERKTEDTLGEDQFGFRRGKETRDAVGMLRIISERTLVIDEELRSCLDQIIADPKGNWNRLARRRLISKLYTRQCQNTTGPRGDEECEDWKRS
jgi:hypothetical protein